MSLSDTKREVLDYLDAATRGMALSSVRELTTAKIANDINVSRNLASQYLNELVREGLVVKVNSHTCSMSIGAASSGSSRRSSSRRNTPP